MALKKKSKMSPEKKNSCAEETGKDAFTNSPFTKTIFIQFFISKRPASFFYIEQIAFLSSSVSAEWPAKKVFFLTCSLSLEVSTSLINSRVVFSSFLALHAS